MTELDLANLSPPDAVAALRSYPRRIREQVHDADEADLVQRIERLGADGRDAVEVIADAARTIGFLGAALDDVLIHDHPVLHPAVTDVTQRRWDGDPPLGLDDAVELFTTACLDLADQAGRAATAAWSRPATIAGTSEDVEAFDVLREAVRVGAAAVREVRTHLTETGA